MGLELGGPKNDRTAVAVLDFYPKTRRLILSEVTTGLGSLEETSADEALVQHLTELHQTSQRWSGLAVHAPTSLPPHFLSPPKGAARKHARDPQSLWMDRQWAKLRPQPRPFLPYLQRPAEVWMKYLTPEKFAVADGLGSNGAPLAARFHFLAPHLPTPVREVFPRATLTRLVSSLGLPKSIAKLYTDLDKGLLFREDFFRAVARKLPQIFLYEKDLETMVLQIQAFHAFLGALTDRLAACAQTEPPPRGFPTGATWIHIPKPVIDWEKVFTS